MNDEDDIDKSLESLKNLQNCLTLEINKLE